MAGDHATPSSTAATDRRLKPYHLSILIGCGIGIFTLVSGIVPTLTGWESDSPIHRTVFGGIPDPLKVAFYTVIPMMLIWGSLRFADRVRNWERGAPERRSTNARNVKRRLADFRAGVYMKTLLRDSAAGLMHSMIYFGFLVLLGVTTVLEVDHQLPPSLKFLHGDVYKGYALVGDVAGVVFTAGVVWAILRRYVQRPYRIRIKSKPEHAAILGVLLAIGVSGFGAEMFRIAAGQAAGENLDYERWSVVGYPLAQFVNGASVANLEWWHQAPRTAADHDAAPRVHFTVEHVPARPRASEGRDAGNAEPRRDVARDVRCKRRRGLHVEAAARPRRMHDVRSVHERVPRPRHRQTARSARNRPEER